MAVQRHPAAHSTPPLPAHTPRHTLSSLGDSPAAAARWAPASCTSPARRGRRGWPGWRRRRWGRPRRRPGELTEREGEREQRMDGECVWVWDVWGRRPRGPRPLLTLAAGWSPPRLRACHAWRRGPRHDAPVTWSCPWRRGWNARACVCVYAQRVCARTADEASNGEREASPCACYEHTHTLVSLLPFHAQKSKKWARACAATRAASPILTVANHGVPPHDGAHWGARARLGG